MLLRDDTQTALNRVESLCLETADGYGSVARQAGDPSLAALFGQTQQQRQRLAAELAPHIRALGDLPRQPDPDREALDHVVDGIKAFLAGDSDAVLLEQRLAADAGLEEAVRAALGEALAPETRDMLMRMLQEVGQMRERLLNARSGA